MVFQDGIPECVIKHRFSKEEISQLFADDYKELLTIIYKCLALFRIRSSLISTTSLSVFPKRIMTG